MTGDEDGPSTSSPRRRGRGDRRTLLPSSASRVSLSSLGSTDTLTPEDLSVTLSGSDLHAFTYSELSAVTAGFSRSNYLGRGGFGPVYKGQVGAQLRPGLEAQAVAVKYLDLDCSTQGHNEWLVIKSTHHLHPTIVCTNARPRAPSTSAPSNFALSKFCRRRYSSLGN